MKKIIIIGASSGLGARIAADFAAAGWRVGVAARREKPLQKLREAYPANVVVKTIDVTAVDAVERFNELIRLTDGMDVMLYCAGVGFTDLQLDDARLVNTLAVNVTGFARLVSAAYRYFRDTADGDTPGQIAAITSVAGVKALGISAAYSASKAFGIRYLNALEQLAFRQQVNVCFTDIRPGFVRTPLLDDSRQYPMIMPVGYASRLIERAIVRRRRVAYIDWRWGVASNLWRLVPQRLWRHIALDL